MSRDSWSKGRRVRLPDQPQSLGGSPYNVDSASSRHLLHGATMQVLRKGQQRVWDEALPEEVRQLGPELARVDEWLRNEELFEPFRKRFACKIGRPTVPVSTFVRLMYLKDRYGLGYETVVVEVRDSLQWRRFCEIPLDGKVPHPTTLSKLAKRYGDDTVKELNEKLLDVARERKVLRGKKLRVDTTTIESDIHHPTDASLLADGVRVVTRTVKHLQEAGAVVVNRIRDRARSVKGRILQIVKVLRKRTGQAIQEVRQVTREIVEITKQVVAQGSQALQEAQASIGRGGVMAALVVEGLTKQLDQAIDLTQRVIEQTLQVEAGVRHIPDRIVSIFDPDARPISRGKLKAPTEFGYKVLLGESEERLITGYEVYVGNPSDDSLLPPAVRQHRRSTGKSPQSVATDRGFSSQANEIALMAEDVQQVCLPRRGKLSERRRAVERRPWFRRLKRWRAGGEATISVLKRKYGLDRSRFRGHRGARTWVGYGVFTYNVRRLTAIG